jgi:hypothetical protein
MVFKDKLNLFKFLKMEQCIKGNGLYNHNKKMEEVFKFGQMDLDMMVSGDKEWLTDMADLYMLKVMYMRENGQKIKLMDLVFILILMEVGMKVTGFKINSMALE